MNLQSTIIHRDGRSEPRSSRIRPGFRLVQSSITHRSVPINGQQDRLPTSTHYWRGWMSAHGRLHSPSYCRTAARRLPLIVLRRLTQEHQPPFINLHSHFAAEVRFECQQSSNSDKPSSHARSCVSTRPCRPLQNSVGAISDTGAAERVMSAQWSTAQGW